jgi:Domain of unknown function (DUF3859)
MSPLPPRRSTVGLLAIASLLFVAPWAAPARAQDMRVDMHVDMRVDRIEIVESGFYDAARTTITATNPAAGAVTGAVQELRDIKLEPQPPAMGAAVGVGFGVRFRSFGERAGERAMLRSVWKIPAPGIVDPATGKVFGESIAEFATTIGITHFRGYSFAEPWEVVPGTWTLEIWQGDRKLLEKSFEIK